MAASEFVSRPGYRKLSSLTYTYTRPDGVCVTTVLADGKANIMEERGEGATSSLTILERAQLTDAETALLKETGATLRPTDLMYLALQGAEMSSPPNPAGQGIDPLTK